VRIEQVLSNLVTNAIKFTPEGGSIDVEAHGTPGQVIVRVTDTGVGMTKEQLDRLFQAFTQVHDNPEQRLRGTGLGLYISKGIIEEHGGSVSAASRGPGQGSTFTVILPATRKAVAAPLPPPPTTRARRYRELI
jgi:signal transduction histidine kinase